MNYCTMKTGCILEISNSTDKNYRYIIIGDDLNNIYTQTKLVFSEQTLIVNCEYNKISIDDLRVGDFVVAYHSNAMTMSIPPQTSVYIIEVK